jgi:enediyne biosynthesis protein E4
MLVAQETNRFVSQLAGLLLLVVVPASAAAPALQWTAQSGGRSAPVRLPAAGKAGFVLMEPQTTGVHFTNNLPAERHYANQILLNGSGVAAGDVDGDGWCDLFFGGLGGGSRLYRNLGDWKFQNITAESGLGAWANLDATGTALADIDGDGDLDLLINSLGQGTLCFLNDGRGRFAPSPTVPILNRSQCGSSLALADVDGNGTLDLYIANYRTSTIRDQPNARFTIKTVNGRPVPDAFGGRSLSSPDLTNRFAFYYKPAPGGGGSVLHDELGEADLFCRNQGGGRFAPVSFSGGTFLDELGAAVTQPLFDWGLSVMMRDFNGDGAPDIYVCNDFATPDRFWINDGNGRLRAAPVSALRQTSLSTMAIDVADINRDGFDDFFTADMLSREHWRRLVQRNEANPNMHLFVDVARQPQSPRNMLQLGRGDGTYLEIAQLAGLEAAEWAWASIFLDVDLDGYEDLLAVNGFERDYMNMDAHRKVKELQARGGPRMPMAEIQRLNRLYPRLSTPNAAFRNLGNLRFADVSAEWGFNVRAVSQGMCLADLDNDGDLDVLINNSNDAATLLRNNTTAARVAVRLKGRAPNSRGIGARIKLLGGAVPSQSQEMIAGGRYLSSDDSMRVFAAGSMTNRLALEVTWRSGMRSILTNIQANRIYEIEEGAANGPAPSQVVSTSRPIFKDVSATVAHNHEMGVFDDFARQPLLPNKLSTLGPGVSWFDVDGDGWDDLIIGGGKGGRMAAHRNDGRGGFARLAEPAFDQALTRAQTTVLGLRQRQANAVLFAGSSNYEDGLTTGNVVNRYELAAAGTPGAATMPGDSFPGSTASVGPMALADVDGDGELDLFVGGRCVPGRWPEPAPSLMFRQAEGKWVLDPGNTKRLATVGLVSGAVFTDIDGDGESDLVLACEWGPLRIFRNDRGFLVEATADFGMDQFKGWWNGVSAGDFDGDGRLDLVASNWGRNTKYERFRSRPLRVTYGDFNGDGGLMAIENWYDEALQKYVPILNVWTMSRSMPWLLEKFPNYETFSQASVEEVLGDRGGAAKHLEASWLDSTVFLNRGGRFEAQPLPVEAQVAPAFGIGVADFDGDGSEDVFLSQNFFGTRTETSRYDAGRGLLLRGDGRGNFIAVSGQQSGLMIYGEQRGAAVGDYDRDGRTDLVVTQAGAETKLFRNETGRPGLRVRLLGPPENPQGIGAVVRLKFAEEFGPAREVHAGSGYWSQDSAVQVMTGPKATTGVWARWPGGKVVEASVPSGAAEVRVDVSGKVERIR